MRLVEAQLSEEAVKKNLLDPFTKAILLKLAVKMRPKNDEIWLGHGPQTGRPQNADFYGNMMIKPGDLGTLNFTRRSENFQLISP